MEKFCKEETRILDEKKPVKQHDQETIKPDAKRGDALSEKELDKALGALRGRTEAFLKLKRSFNGQIEERSLQDPVQQYCQP